MRVLLIEPSLTDNGALRVSLDRAQRWPRQDVEVDLLILSHDIASGDRQVEMPADLAPSFATRRSQRLRYALPIALLQTIRFAARADVIVAGREIDTGLLMAAIAARVLRRPLAVTVQSNVESAVEHHVSPRLRNPTLSALRRADLAVCVAEGLVSNLVRIGLSPQRTQVVHNGLDVEGLRQAAARAPTFSLPDGPFVVGTGRLTRQKGFDLLVRAHAKALKDGALAHTVVILGEGPDRSALEHLVRELGVEKSVWLPGFVANPHAVVARSDLFVFPSRWEGFGLGLAEALCLGTPSIAADCIAGPSEVLRDGTLGQLVPVEDVGALAAAIAAHLVQPRDLRARAVVGAADAAERFNPDRAAQRHLDLLTDLVRTHKRKPTP